MQNIVRRYFPVTSDTTSAALRQAVADSHILNAVLFKYSVNTYSVPRQLQQQRGGGDGGGGGGDGGGGGTAAGGHAAGDTPVTIAVYQEHSEGLRLQVVGETVVDSSSVRTVADVRALLSAPGGALHGAAGAPLAAGYFLGRFRPADAERESSPWPPGPRLSQLPYHGHWLYASDDDMLELAPGSRLFVVPKLPRVSLVGLDNDVRLGSSSIIISNSSGDTAVAAETAAPATLKALGAQHLHQFQLTGLLRPGHKPGDAPREVVLKLYFTDEDHDDDEEEEEEEDEEEEL